MSAHRSLILTRVLLFAVAVLIVKVTVAVVLAYGNYFPPNFQSDFLHGRDGYFFTRYQWVFCPHIVSGPISLLMGLLLLSDRLRMRFPAWHRRLGRVHIANVLLVVTPSGFVMAWDAAAGPSAVVAFVMLALLTAVCTALGWRTAVKRQFAIHRRWMQRSFVLLGSAVVLRVMGGLAAVLDMKALWFDPVVSWACWLLPLLILEACHRSRTRGVKSIKAVTSA